MGAPLGNPPAPAAKLVPPQPQQPMPDAVDKIISFSDYASLGHWAAWLIGKICGVNPAEWAGKLLAGDWESFSKFASALDHVAAFYQEYGAQLKDGSATMLKQWDGQAADACGGYFENFSSAVGRQVDPVRTVAADCRSVAFGSWSTAKAVVSGVEAFLDWVIAKAIVAASSWLLGPQVGMAAILVIVTEGLVKWLSIISKVGAMVAVVYGFIGLVAGSLGALHGLKSQPLPKTSYDNAVI
ncbi:hypothetical protein ACFQ07_31480 [Actinomadura adrarensis]|uniref:WXG100 family type VII secretion target n=1 Tax=Actinomadura adrarensis TaxID=1819600 RepID=A0ABW3CQY1_9ACTN